MTDSQTLQKAIGIAIENGWKGYWGDTPVKLESTTSTFDAISGMPTVSIHILHKDRVFGYGGIPIFNVIYNHDFAKALWGEDDVCNYCGTNKHDAYCERQGNCQAWEYHLQNMVISPDPIAYLRDHMEEK